MQAPSGRARRGTARDDSYELVLHIDSSRSHNKLPRAVIRRPSRSTQGTVFRSPVELAWTSCDVAVWVPKSAGSRACAVTVMRIVVARVHLRARRLLTATHMPSPHARVYTLPASAQHAARGKGEARSTHAARRTHGTRRNRATRNTDARVTKYEVRVSCASASWRSAKSSSWTDFGSR